MVQVLVEVDRQQTLCYNATQCEYDNGRALSAMSDREVCAWAVERARRETRVSAFHHSTRCQEEEEENEEEQGDDELSLCVEMDRLCFSGEKERESERSTNDDDVLFVSLSLSSSLAAGKGGFGAQLRALARQRGKKPTTNFSACRDLQGRRLRHVNDELLLEKWRDSQARGEDFDPGAATASGVPLWFLSTPSWAAVPKSDRKARYRAAQDKRSLCRDWLAARESLSVSERESKPRHWGCPRGERCGFAHGEDDLRGAARESATRAKEDEEKNRRAAEKSAFLAPLEAEQARRSDEVVRAMVLRGLQRERETEREKERESKRAKIERESDAPAETERETERETESEKERETETAFVELVSGECIVRYNYLDSAPQSERESPLNTLSQSAVATATVVAENMREKESEKERERDGRVALLTAHSAFPSLIAHAQPHSLSLSQSSSVCHAAVVRASSVGCGLSVGRWYYEAELLSDGLMQIGFCADGALCGESAFCSARGEGVGDDALSWAVDGLRERLFHAGREQEIVWVCETESEKETESEREKKNESEKEKEKGWSVGDVVGCYLSLTVSPHNSRERHAQIAFSLNGRWASKSFSFSLSAEREGEAERVFFPALSLEKGESVLLNTGGAPFRYFPLSAPPSSGVTRERLTENERDVLKKKKIHAVCEIDTLTVLEESDFVEEIVEKKAAAVVVYDPINLESAPFETLESLEALGLDHLKSELSRRGLKAGGSLRERASRLLQVRGVPADKIDKKLKAK